MDTKLYSKNWKSIALRIKIEANWCCTCCGKHCYRPGEIPKHQPRRQWASSILQVHHKNHDRLSNQVSNLQAVCAACHLNLHRSRYSPVSPGQLKLF